MLKLRKTKTEKGITLIALIITIVVLLILAIVAITAINKYNIIDNANAAAKKYGEQVGIENTTLGKYDEEIDKYMGGISGGNDSGENTGTVTGDPINKQDSYIGYYADVDADGNIDGIIYADLAVSKSGKWGSNENGKYSYGKKTNLNNYVVRDATQTEKELFKDAIDKVIMPIGNSKEENDRFYVMALKDVNSGKYYCWYDDVYNNMFHYETATSGDFGTGKANTEAMIEKWNSKSYGEQNTGICADMWGVIQNEVENGWFVPSRAEWSAFADALSINDGNYSQYGLSFAYWSSSQFDKNYAWRAYFKERRLRGLQRCVLRQLCSSRHDFLICKN